MKIRHLYCEVELFETLNQSLNFDQLPIEFKSAYELYQAGSDENWVEIIELLSPFIAAKYAPVDRLKDWEKIFVAEGGSLEIESLPCTIINLQYTGNPIPNCSALTVFEINVVDNFDDLDLEALRLLGNKLESAVHFYWKLPTDKTGGLDFSMSSYVNVDSHFLEN